MEGQSLHLNVLRRIVPPFKRHPEETVPPFNMNPSGTLYFFWFITNHLELGIWVGVKTNFKTSTLSKQPSF